MAIHLTKTQARVYGLRPPSVPRPRRDDGYDSQLEADYAAYLDTCAGIRMWRYHPWTFILVHGKSPVRYTPDFLVIPYEGQWEIHETKGFWRPKDRVIMKLCAERWRAEFAIVGVQRIYGQWDTEEF